MKEARITLDLRRINIEVEDEKPEAPVISAVNVSGNNATVVLAGESDGATGYDYVISTDRDCINNKDYDKVNKNILSTETTFTYTQQGCILCILPRLETCRWCEGIQRLV